MTKPALYHKRDEDGEGNDYVLREGETSCWIEVGDICVYIVRTDEGVAVDLFPTGDEMGSELASCWASFEDAIYQLEQYENE